MFISKKLSLLICSTALAAPAVGAVFPVFAAETVSNIEEILVSARKRGDEALIEVPDAVTVFTADRLEAAGVKNVTDIANLTPNMFFTPTYRPSEMQMTIRGIPTAQG